MPGMPRKAFAIAAVISRAANHRVERSMLGEHFWPALEPAQRANNLRQLLFRVRRIETMLGCVFFDVSDQDVALGRAVECDLVEFDSLSRADEKADVELVLSAYGGTLLEGHVASDHGPRSWLADQRSHLEAQFVDVLLASLEDALPGRRKSILGRAIAIAPGALGLRRAMMRQLISAGMIEEARREYREIRHIGGPGAIAAPPELLAATLPASTVVLPAVPPAQLGRDQARVPRLLLLPPRGAAAQGAQGLLAEALIDDVTVALTRLRSISILAPHTARRIANDDDLRRSGLAQADFVLRSKLRSAGATQPGSFHRFTLLLERASTGDVVWAESVSFKHMVEPLQFAAVANGVALTLVDQIERETLRTFQVPADAGAYGQYLLGQRALQVLDLPSTRRARASFKTAIGLAPQFAPAHTGYAQSLIYEWVITGRGDADLVERARRAAGLALDIDPLFGCAHQMLGRASLFAGDFTGSLEHLERAESLNPHHADLLCDFADTLMHSSHAQRANDKIGLALELNPLAPDAYWWASAGIKFFVGDYETALNHLGKVKNSEPVLRLTAACAAMAGQDELAARARNRFLAIVPGFKIDDWIGVLPVRDPAHREHYHHALQKAGFK